MGLSKFLEVPLKVAAVHTGCSRSYLQNPFEQGPLGGESLLRSWAGGVGDATAKSVPSVGGREWPLFYGRSLEKSRFETAVRLFMDNLHQFLYSQGYNPLIMGSSVSLLENTEIILRKEIYAAHYGRDR